MQWNQIIGRDPFLAGSLAAREYEWWQEVSAESEADRVELLGEARQRFVEGWQFEVAEQERERKARLQQEWEAWGEQAWQQVLKGGDPANW